MSLVSAAIDIVSKQLPRLECRREEPMSRHTSFRIGGAAAAMFFPKTAEEAAALCRSLADAGVRPLIVGNGSNLLVEDGRLELIAVKTGGYLTEIVLTGETELTAGSGVLLSQLANAALEHGLRGLEFAHGIPGTLGGAIVMNAGAYGGEIKDVVTETVAVSPAGAFVRTVGDAHEFSYRHSPHVLRHGGAHRLIRPPFGKGGHRGNPRLHGGALPAAAGKPAASFTQCGEHV
jgi:UDP-N-acetylmuramate dehydrogenase